MQGSTQTMALALRRLTVVEGTLRRALPKLHALVQTELLASDLNGYANLREAWMYALRALQYSLEARGVDPAFLGRFMETVEPVTDDLWTYAVDSPPPMDIQNEMTTLFPEWLRAMEENVPLMEEGPTRVDTQGSVDPDSVDVALLLRELELRGYNGALEAPVDEQVFGVPIIQTVSQAVRMAAMYDLYMDLRLGSTRARPEPRRRWKVPGPEWILLGLGLATTASHAASEVLRAQAKRKKRMSVSELSELIRKSEGV